MHITRVRSTFEKYNLTAIDHEKQYGSYNYKVFFPVFTFILQEKRSVQSL